MLGILAVPKDRRVPPPLGLRPRTSQSKWHHLAPRGFPILHPGPALSLPDSRSVFAARLCQC